MSEAPENPKIVRLPVPVRAKPSYDEIHDDDAEKQRLREQILELLSESEDDIEQDALPKSEAEWLPAPKSMAPSPQLPDTPSPYHRNAIECPQCDRWTWQATEECKWCDYNLFAHYQRVEDEKLARRREWIHEYNTRRRGRMALWVLGLLALGVGLISKAAAAPDPLRQWVVPASLLALAAAAIVAKLMPPE